MDYTSIQSVTEETIKEMGYIDYMVDTFGGGVFKGLKDYDFVFSISKWNSFEEVAKMAVFLLADESDRLTCPIITME